MTHSPLRRARAESPEFANLRLRQGAVDRLELVVVVLAHLPS
jgi:hypothetical protein